MHPMPSRLTSLLLATAVWLLLAVGLLHSQPTVPAATAERQRYLIFLHDAPLATYDGRDSRYPATSPAHTGHKLDEHSPAVQAYASYLASQRTAAVEVASAALGRPIEPLIQFGVVANGLGVELTVEEAAVLAALPTIAHIAPEPVYELHTDSGPAHIGAAELWSHPTLATRGEGVLVGLFDTGIDPTNPSFAATSAADGYIHINPLGAGNYRGICDPNQTMTETQTIIGPIGGILPYDETFPCNDKLIGVWGYAWSDASPRDRNGHGSHTASTVVGNPVQPAVVVAPTINLGINISGVAPRASLIAYDVCQDNGACFGFAIIMAQNQAILDGVDVVNFSAGGRAATDPWGDPIAQTWLAMREAGIFVAVSAGNNGPELGTIGSPADLPWVTSVAAASHPRRFQKQLILHNSAGDNLTLTGESLTAGLLSDTPVVIAADYAGYGTAEQSRLCAPSNFPPQTFAGALVICAHGFYSRLLKGQAVLDGGGVGMIMTHEYGVGGLLIGPHLLPTILLDETASLALYSFISETLAAETGPVLGRITSIQVVRPAEFGDLTAPFSSRGPNAGAGLANVMVPKLTAPGRNIIAALGQGAEGDAGTPSFGVLSGTSMSSPHVAGAAVLLRALHPTWSPAQIESALMSTAVPTLLDDAQTPATPFDEGAGRIDVLAAAQAGLVLDVPAGAFMAANPELGGDPRQLNVAGLVDGACIGQCVWTRVLQSVANQPVVWQASLEGVGGSVSPAQFTLQPGQSQTVIITAEVALPEGWQFGAVRLVPDTAAISPAHLPIAAFSQASNLPTAVNLLTHELTGTAVLTGLEAITITEGIVTIQGLVRGEMTQTLLAQDSTRSNPYDDLTRVWVVTTTVPTETARLVVELVQTSSRDLDLFVGTGLVPTATAEISRSATAETLEAITLLNPEPGVYWVVVQNWLSSQPRQPDVVQLVLAAVPLTNTGNLAVAMPSAVPLRQPFELAFAWDEPHLVDGDRWYGLASFWADATAEAPFAQLPINLRYELVYPIYLPVVAR